MESVYRLYFLYLTFAVARNNIFFICIGLSIGTTCGYFIGTWMARPYYPTPVMKAVACYNFREPDVNYHRL